MEGVSTAKIVLFHQGSIELRRCKNCIFVLPVSILMGIVRRILGPHDTLPCVLILVDNHEINHYSKMGRCGVREFAQYLDWMSG